MFRVEFVGKSFGSFRALTDVSLSVREGEIRAIIGPNGAGKTTFVNIVSGVIRSTTGRIFVAGRTSPRSLRNAVPTLVWRGPSRSPVYSAA